MITGIDITNFCIASIGMTISIMGLFLALRIQFMETWLKRFFIVVFSIMTLYVLSDFVSQISLVMLGSSYTALSRAAIFLESFFSSLLMPVLAACIVHVSGQKINSTFFYHNLGLWTTYFILLVFTQFTRYFYYLTPDNIYHRGPLYPILLIPPVLMSLCNIIGVYNRRNLLSEYELTSFLLYLLVPLISMVLQMISYGLLLIVLGTTIAGMIMFRRIMDYQISKHIKQNQELVAQQLTIRTLQMRPHFIYNTLSNIYYLCDQNPKKAQQAVDDFTRYLRKNFTAMTKQEPIPFEEELEHARAYLAVVKVRFEDLLFVEYDTEFTSFKLPPLTLEPIVENSVKHGLDPDSSPLHILVSTRKLDRKVVLTVEDTGTGFDTADTAQKKTDEKSNEPHIGLENVKTRLSEMCHGTLEISPREMGGTIVTITVPLTLNKHF